MSGLKVFAIIVLAFMAWDAVKFLVTTISNNRARFSFYLGVIILLMLCSIIGGCATERPSPGDKPTGDVCSHDGTYEFINCKRFYP